MCFWKCIFGLLVAKWNTWSIWESLALSCWAESKDMFKLICRKCSFQPTCWQECFIKREKNKSKFLFLHFIRNLIEKAALIKWETEHEYYKLLHPIQATTRPNCKYQVFQMSNSDRSNRLKYIGKSCNFKECKILRDMMYDVVFLTGHVCIPHPQESTSNSARQSKGILERQQSIYYIFTHASELPCLEVYVHPSSSSTE